MYEIQILTPAGLKTVVFNPQAQTVEQLEKELTAKYGIFTTIQSKKV